MLFRSTTPTINNYLTLAYNKIPKTNTDRKLFRDFRNDIDVSGIDDNSAKGILGTGNAKNKEYKDYYQKNNLSWI